MSNKKTSENEQVNEAKKQPISDDKNKDAAKKKQTETNEMDVNEEIAVEEQTQELTEENALQKELDELKQELGETQESLLRVHAEFDNFRKRTQKEMSATYQNAVADTVKEFLDVVDNLARAGEAANESTEKTTEEVQKGVALIFEQTKKILKQLNVEEINPKDEAFNPDYHNAVMHIEDENLGENTICEVFQKGYKINDRVLRYAMVKVAN